MPTRFAMRDADTSSEALDRVLALAEKATPGTWSINPICGTVDATIDPDDGHRYVVHVFDGMDDDDQDVQHIAAAHPAFVASLIREVKRLREATTWRPVETAPKDGTRVLIIAEHDGCAHEARVIESEWFGPHRSYTPTAWMPLPSTEET